MVKYKLQNPSCSCTPTGMPCSLLRLWGIFAASQSFACTSRMPALLKGEPRLSKNAECTMGCTPSPGEKVAQQIHLKHFKSNEFGESEEECGRRTEPLYCVRTYSDVQHGQRYEHRQSTKITARIPLQPRQIFSSYRHPAYRFIGARYPFAEFKPTISC